MKDKLIIIISDNNYINHAKYLISNILSDGKYVGDICLISNGIEDSELKKFEEKNIIIYKMNKYVYPQYYCKYYIFDIFFKKWKKILYLDCDTMVLSDINYIFSLKENIYFCEEYNLDGHRYTILDHFNIMEKDFPINEFENLKMKYDISKDSFNSGVILFNSEIINDNTLNDVLFLHDEFLNVNNHVSTGTDQPIMNIYFNNWFGYPNNMVNYWSKNDERSIILHFYRWSAPWEPNMNYNNKIKNIYYYKYVENLENFEKIKNLYE